MQTDSTAQSASPNHSPWRKLVSTIARTVISLALAIFLIHVTLKSTGSDIIAVLKDANPALLLVAFLMYSGVLGLTMARWYLLLRVQGIEVSFAEVARLSMIGFFFNLAIPGATGGDLVKMAFVSRLTPGKRTEAVFTIMVDRIIGIFGLFIIATIVVLLSFPFLRDLGAEHRKLQVGALLVGLGSMGGIAGILLVEFHHLLLRHSLVRRLLDYGERRLPHIISDTVRRLAGALDLYRRNRRAMLIALLLSLGVHSLLALELFCIGRAVHETALRVQDYFLVTQVVNALAAVPLTPAGLGVRDIITSMFFNAMNVPREISGAIPVILSIGILCWGLVGAIVFIVGAPGRAADRRAHRRADDSEGVP